MNVTPAPRSPYEPQMGQVMELIGGAAELIGGLFGPSEEDAIRAEAQREQERLAATAELERVRARIAQEQAQQQMVLQQEQSKSTQRMLIIGGGIALAGLTLTMLLRRRS